MEIKFNKNKKMVNTNNELINEIELTKLFINNTENEIQKRKELEIIWRKKLGLYN